MKKLFSIVLLFALGIGLVGCSDAASDSSSSPKTEEKTEKKVVKKAEPNLGMDSETFEKNWADLSDSIGGNIPLPDGEEGSGAVNDTKSYDLTDHASIVTTIDKDNHLIKEITVISMASDAAVDNTKTLLVYTLAIGSADPSLVPDERGEVFSGLTDQNPNFDYKDVYYEKNGIKYGLLISKSAGIWLTITPADLQ